MSNFTDLKPPTETPILQSPKSKASSQKEKLLQSLASPSDEKDGKVRIDSNPKEELFMHNQLEQQIRKAGKPRKIYSSTSSVYAEHTLSDPNNDQVLYCIGAVLQAQMFDDIYNDEYSSEEFPEFNLPMLKLPAEYGGEREVIPEEILNHETLNDNELRELLLQRALPTVDTIYRFFKYLMVISEYSIECNIIALVYINRITVRNKMAVTMQNWRGLWLGAIILAQKVWDDKPLKTSSFCSMVPDLKKDAVIAAEFKCFSLLDFCTTVRPSVYAKYFFELHELFREITGSNQGFHWNLQPLSIAEKKKLENRSEKESREYMKELEKRTRRKNKKAAEAGTDAQSTSMTTRENNSGDEMPALASGKESPGEQLAMERMALQTESTSSPAVPSIMASASEQPSSVPQSTQSVRSALTTSASASSRFLRTNHRTNSPLPTVSMTLEDATYSSNSRYVIN